MYWTRRKRSFPNRTSQEIYRDILEAIDKGAHLRTHIMQKSNLCWTELMPRLEAMVVKDWLTVTEENDHPYFEITEEGKEVLRLFSVVFNGLC